MIKGIVLTGALVVHNNFEEEVMVCIYTSFFVSPSESWFSSGRSMSALSFGMASESIGAQSLDNEAKVRSPLTSSQAPT